MLLIAEQYSIILHALNIYKKYCHQESLLSQEAGNTDEFLYFIEQKQQTDELITRYKRAFGKGHFVYKEGTFSLKISKSQKALRSWEK